MKKEKGGKQEEAEGLKILSWTRSYTTLRASKCSLEDDCLLEISKRQNMLNSAKLLRISGGTCGVCLGNTLLISSLGVTRARHTFQPSNSQSVAYTSHR